MNNIEKQLMEEKKRLESITAPEELEMRLRNALHSIPPKSKKRKVPLWSVAVASIFCLFIFSYHYNALAFYSKKLFGFDDLMSGTLQDLNEEGMGQVIEKKTKLQDSTDFILNGIMTDANRLIMYYTLRNPDGIDEQTSDFFMLSNISGFLTESNAEGSISSMNEEKTEVKGTMSFEPVNPFAKQLTLHFREVSKNGQTKEGQMTFPYNPNKAMQAKTEHSIRKTVKVDKGTITFHSITATPTLTVIKGSLNVKNFDRVDSALDGVQLIANGKPIEVKGGSVQSALIGREFDIRYDALPKQLDSLQLVVKEFAGYKKLDQKLSLTSTDKKPISLASKELWVKNVATTEKGIELTISTEQDVMLDGVSISAQNTVTPLETTVNEILTTENDGRILKERTLIFDTKTMPEYVLINGMHFMKPYNRIIDIPVD
ncbi:DUF4179 domain-containing protein [Bacillus massiliigorillae]|uniref:DUF4179 domain-containing protein n=1 Tax=Bacillus massiliigorillae TaxID=1243664 RepID=UPI0003A00980|nr:DUF4179 domain-containing protein [Bacillus massiliigorillae]